MTTIKSLATIFDEWCRKDQGQAESVKERYGFNLRVVCSKDIPPRHSIFSWIRGLGVSKYDEIFSGELNMLPKDWLLAFPERHISVHEQKSLIHQLVKLNREKKLGMEQLDILTSSPMIISDTMMESLSIICFPNGKITYDQDYMSF